MRGGVVLAAGLLALGGCGGGGVDPPPAACPRIAILADAADLTRFRPDSGQDLSAMVLDARVAGFNARCDYARRGGGLDVTLTVTLDVERGPGATGRTVDLPWFVAVTDTADTQIYNRRDFATRAVFPANVTRTRVEGEPIGLTLPFGEGRRTDDYAVRIGFQVTPEELALNRRRGPR